MSDPAKYRTTDELEDYRKQDPILILQGAPDGGAGALTDGGVRRRWTSAARRLRDEAAALRRGEPRARAGGLYEDVLA